MTAKSTKTNKATNHDAPQAPAQEAPPTNTDHDQTTPTVEDTDAEASTPEPAANPANQPAVEPSTDYPMGDSDSGEAGDDPGPNMTSHDYDALHGLTSNVHDDSATGEQPPLALLTAERIGLTPRQHVTSIIAGGVISGILARTKPYEVLDLRKAAEAIGMCDTIVDMILHLDDPAPEAQDEQPNS
ncbi:hypothetical protein [Akkermansia sp.]|uniref:hypothetical protein n=1 Tax=Akkermansia sp. TaxID=1872421 RepID=UPI003AF16F63